MIWTKAKPVNINRMVSRIFFLIIGNTYWFPKENPLLNVTSNKRELMIIFAGGIEGVCFADKIFQSNWQVDSLCDSIMLVDLSDSLV